VLNTEVLAGKGADIFLMDELPIDSYIEKGVLMDMSDIFMPMIKEWELLQNIASNYVQENAVYAMPLRFCVPIYTINEDIKEPIDSVEQLSKIVVSSDRELLPPCSYQSLLQTFLYIYYDQYVTDSGQLKEMELRAFLKQVKIIADSIDIIDYNDEVYRDKDYWRLGVEQIERIPSIGRIVKPCMLEFLETNSLASMEYDESFFDLINIAVVKDYINGSCCSMNNTFIPNCIMGVNRTSKEPELAKDFVGYVFSKECQSTLKYGYPINMAAFDSVVNDRESVIGAMFFYSEKENKVGSIYFDSRYHNIGNMISWIYELETPVYNNDTVIKIIVEKALPYFTGEKDLDTVCQDIVNKVNLYLSE
jgi:hypothetical protein